LFFRRDEHSSALVGERQAGGDVELMVGMPEQADRPALLSARIGASVSHLMQRRRVDLSEFQTDAMPKGGFNGRPMLACQRVWRLTFGTPMTSAHSGRQPPTVSGQHALGGNHVISRADPHQTYDGHHIIVNDPHRLDQ